MQPGFLRHLGLPYRMRGIKHAIVTARSTTSVTGAPQFCVFFVSFIHFSRCGLCISHFKNENQVSEQAGRTASSMRQGGSEPRAGQGTGVQHKLLMLTGTDVHRSRRFASCHLEEETIITNSRAGSGPSSNPALC